MEPDPSLDPNIELSSVDAHNADVEAIERSDNTVPTIVIEEETPNIEKEADELVTEILGGESTGNGDQGNEGVANVSLVAENTGKRKVGRPKSIKQTPVRGVPSDGSPAAQTKNSVILTYRKRLTRLYNEHGKQIRRKVDQTRGISILSSDSEPDTRSRTKEEERTYPNRKSFGLLPEEMAWIRNHMVTLNREDPHNMRPHFYYPLLAQNSPATEAFFSESRWFEDFSQYGLFQCSTLAYWPPHFSENRFDFYRRSETRLVTTPNPVEEDLVFNTTSSLTVPKKILRGSKVVFEAPEGFDFLFAGQELYTKTHIPTNELDLNDSDEESEVPIMRSLIPDRGETADFEMRRLGMVDEAYTGTATLGGNIGEYFAPAVTDEDIELLQEFEQDDKKNSIPISRRHQEALTGFQQMIKEVLPAASEVFNLTPAAGIVDSEEIGEHTVLLEHAHVLVQDMWQKLVDHYTRVERRRRRLEKSGSVSHPSEEAILVPDMHTEGPTSIPPLSHAPSVMNVDQPVWPTHKESQVDVSTDSSDDQAIDLTGNDESNYPRNDPPSTTDIDADMAETEFGANTDEISLKPATQTVEPERVSEAIDRSMEFDNALERASEEDEDDWLERLTSVVSDSYWPLTLPIGDYDAAKTREMDENGEIIYTLHPTELEEESVEESESWIGYANHFARLEEQPLGADNTYNWPELRDTEKIRWINAKNSLLARFEPFVPPPPDLPSFELSDLRPLARPFKVTRITHELLVSDLFEWIDEMMDGLFKHATAVAIDRMIEVPALQSASKITRTYHAVFDEMLGVDVDLELRELVMRKVQLIYENVPFQRLWPRGKRAGYAFFRTRSRNPFRLLIEGGMARLNPVRHDGWVELHKRRGSVRNREQLKKREALRKQWESKDGAEKDLEKDNDGTDQGGGEDEQDMAIDFGVDLSVGAKRARVQQNLALVSSSLYRGSAYAASRFAVSQFSNKSKGDKESDDQGSDPETHASDTPRPTDQSEDDARTNFVYHRVSYAKRAASAAVEQDPDFIHPNELLHLPPTKIRKELRQLKNTLRKAKKTPESPPKPAPKPAHRPKTTRIFRPRIHAFNPKSTSSTGPTAAVSVNVPAGETKRSKSSSRAKSTAIRPSSPEHPVEDVSVPVSALSARSTPSAPRTAVPTSPPVLTAAPSYRTPVASFAPKHAAFPSPPPLLQQLQASQHTQYTLMNQDFGGPVSLYPSAIPLQYGVHPTFQTPFFLPNTDTYHPAMAQQPGPSIFAPLPTHAAPSIPNTTTAAESRIEPTSASTILIEDDSPPKRRRGRPRKKR